MSPLSLARVTLAAHAFAALMISALLLYLVNNYLVYWQEMPGPYALLEHYGWFDPDEAGQLDDERIAMGWKQIAAYSLFFLLALLHAWWQRHLPLRDLAQRLQSLSAYVVRGAFWAVMLIGFVDMIISMLRIEGLLGGLVGEQLLKELGRPSFRGEYVHYPLLLLGYVLALFLRNVSFAWLSLLVVLAEFAIVITRFVFSYEQAYMGDLVRFWYAALFLFASAYTLVHEGHVRVDVFYANFSRVKKAWANIVGSLFLGIPLCWVILMHGMGGRGNSINSPFLSFEISQSAYGMYVKYLMAGFLVIFAVSMMIQFVSYLVLNIARLVDPRPEDEPEMEGMHRPVEVGDAPHAVLPDNAGGSR